MSPGPQPVGKGAKPNTMLPGMALGYPRGPEDLLLEDDGSPVRIDKAFTWDAPMSGHQADARGDRQCTCWRSA